MTSVCYPALKINSCALVQRVLPLLRRRVSWGGVLVRRRDMGPVDLFAGSKTGQKKLLKVWISRYCSNEDYFSALNGQPDGFTYDVSPSGVRLAEIKIKWDVGVQRYTAVCCYRHMFSSFCRLVIPICPTLSSIFLRDSLLFWEGEFSVKQTSN